MSLSIDEGAECFSVTVTVSVSVFPQDEDNRKIVETAMAAFGALHLSFLNAGTMMWKTLSKVTYKAIDTIFGANFKGVVYGLKLQEFPAKLLQITGVQ